MHLLAIILGSFLGSLLDVIVVVPLVIAFLVKPNTSGVLLGSIAGLVVQRAIQMTLIGGSSALLSIPFLVGGLLSNLLVFGLVACLRLRKASATDYQVNG